MYLHLKGFAGAVSAPSREGGAPSRSPQSKMKLGGGNASAVPLLLLSLAGELSQEFYIYIERDSHFQGNSKEQMGKKGSNAPGKLSFRVLSLQLLQRMRSKRRATFVFSQSVTSCSLQRHTKTQKKILTEIIARHRSFVHLSNTLGVSTLLTKRLGK